MGHLVFLVLHVAAIVVYPAALWLTVPLHVIYAALRPRAAPRPNPWTHVRCPDCRELIRKDAAVCSHCGCRLVPSA
jgi:hypothetical protein